MNPNKDNTPSSETVDEILRGLYNYAYNNGRVEVIKSPELTKQQAKHSLRQAIEGMAERISQVRVINHAACSINGKNHGESCRTQSRLQEAWQAQAKEEINKLFGKE